MREQFENPLTAAKFGLYSDALWVFAIAMSIALGFIIGFQYSWPVFLFAAATQILIQALMMLKYK